MDSTWIEGLNTFFSTVTYFLGFFYVKAQQEKHFQELRRKSLSRKNFNRGHT